MKIKDSLRRWLEIDECVTVNGFLNSWKEFKRKGIGIGVEGKEYPPNFENWMNSLIEELETQDEPK